LFLLPTSLSNFNIPENGNVKIFAYFFHIRTVHLDINKVIFSPTNAQVNRFKNNIKIYITMAATCFGAVTPSSGSSLSAFAKVTLC
jgi:hypothetical protein